MAAFFVGTAAGAGAWQLASERSSRRRLLYSGCVLAGVAGIMTCTAPTLWLLLLFRMAQGAAVALMAAAACALACDVVGPSWRTFQGLLLQHFFSLGACLSTVLAWAVPSWRAQAFLAALALLLYVGTWSYVVESPSWLLINGRKVGGHKDPQGVLGSADHRGEGWSPPGTGSRAGGAELPVRTHMPTRLLSPSTALPPSPPILPCRRARPPRPSPRWPSPTAAGRRRRRWQTRWGY